MILGRFDEGRGYCVERVGICKVSRKPAVNVIDPKRRLGTPGDPIAVTKPPPAVNPICNTEVLCLKPPQIKINPLPRGVDMRSHGRAVSVLYARGRFRPGNH